MRTSAAAHPRRAPRPAHRRRRVDDRTVIGFILGATLLILGLMALISWTSSRAQTLSGTVSGATNIDPAALLPLAAPVDPVVGGHDMSNLPDVNAVRAGAVTRSGPQPDVDVPRLRWDWGTIPPVPAMEQTFPIQNQGDEPLLITNVVTSCGCTTAALSSSVIPAGQRADLKVFFDPNFHRTAGPVTRLVWLETNDPDMPLVEIRLDANVTP